MKLYTKLQGYVQRCASRYAQGEDRQDTFQELMIKVLEIEKKFERGPELVALKIAKKSVKNLAVNLAVRRNWYSKRAVPLDEILQVWDRDEENKRLCREIAGDIFSCIKPEYFDTFKHIAFGFTIQEAASLSNVSPSSIYREIERVRHIYLSI